MPRPIESDGRGGVREYRPPTTSSRLAGVVADDVRGDLAAGREVVTDMVRSIPRDAVTVARVGAMASVAAAPAARYVYDRAFGWVEQGIGGGGASGSGRGAFLAGWFWSRARRWRLGVERWDTPPRRGVPEVLSDTAGAVWSSVWRRGA